MDLFKKDKASEEYYKYKEAREKFTEENVDMKVTLNQKVDNPKNIQYDKVHTTIYDQVGLGNDWRVDNSLVADEIETAANSFQGSFTDLANTNTSTDSTQTCANCTTCICHVC